MRKKIVGIAVVAVVAIVAMLNIYTSENKLALSDLALENVEALANNESSGPNYSCFKSFTMAPNDGSLAIWARRCSDCRQYWATSGSDSQECSY